MSLETKGTKMHKQQIIDVVNKVIEGQSSWNVTLPSGAICDKPMRGKGVFINAEAVLYQAFFLELLSFDTVEESELPSLLRAVSKELKKKSSTKCYARGKYEGKKCIRLLKQKSFSFLEQYKK